MLAAGCSERCPTAVADRDAGPAIAMASGDTITIATTITATIATTVTITVTTTVPSTGSSTATSSAAPTSTSAATVRERGGCRQGSDHQSEHEHAESCHVAPPP